MRLEPSGAVVPDLARSLESEDGQRWTLKLREGITFTDGTAYDAQAVLAHVERYKSPKTTARDAAEAKEITSVKKVDDLTVEFRLARPNLDFPQTLTGSLGMVPSPTAVAKDPQGFGMKPVGAGPFKVASFKPGGNLVLERNPDYHDTRYPYLDKLTMVTATDSKARLAAVEAGSLDLVPTTSTADFAKAEAAGLKVLEQPLLTYYYLTLNLSKPPFNDASMRKALTQAIDTKAISTVVFHGRAPSMKGWFVANHPEYTEVGYPKFDPAAAKAAVEKYEAQGQAATVEIQMVGSPENTRTVEVIQQMLADVGIEAKVSTLDQPTSILNAARGNYQAAFRYIGFTLGATSDMRTRFRSGSAGTITHAGNAELDRIIDKLSRTPVKDRHELYAEAQRVLGEWMPSVPLVQQVGAWIVDDSVGGFPGTQGEQTVDMVRMKYIWAK
jgi:peptide/nickel transport system substrate-binding protein